MSESGRLTVAQRRAAAVLVLGTAISLTAATAGAVPAWAKPTTEPPSPTTVATAPHETVIPTVVLEPQTQATVAPEPTLEPTTQAPTVVTQAPQVSEAPTTTVAPEPTGVTTAATTTVTSSPTVTTSITQTSQVTTQANSATSTPVVSGTTTQTNTATTTSGSATASSSVASPQVTPTETPTQLEATAQNIEIAKASKPIEQNPPPASQTDIDSIKNMLNPTSQTATAAPSLAADAKSNVKQFQQDWVRYDANYRPVIINPYPEPLKVVYNYAGAPHIVVIPPLGSAVTEVAQFGVYSFTALVLNTVGAIVHTAVGSFNGGGYVPGPGQQPPAPPPPPVQYENVPVQVKYTNATYKPFVVQRIVDVGMDPVVGAQKVLLDGVTPAWGAWVQTADGQRQFEVHKTQQFPGLDDPEEGALPGDYQLQLASASQSPSSGLSTKDLILIGGAVLVMLLGLGAIVLNVMLGRRRPLH